MNEQEHILMGYILTDVLLAADRMAIKFLYEGGEVIAQCDADCCSHTWIEQIELPALGFPALVTDVQNLEMPYPSSSTDSDGLDEEVIQYYGLKIVTDKGDIIIDYRNESNGYYGGDLIFPSNVDGVERYYYGGVYGQNVSNLEFKPLSEVLV